MRGTPMMPSSTSREAGRLTARMAPRVSMGMPVRNGEPYLEQALQSLLKQTFGDFELLISDNASTDRTQSICLDYASMDRRIRYHRNAVNVGFCRNQNSVIEAASGEFFLLTHHDDIRSPDYVSRTLEVLDADPSLVVCYTRTRDIDEHGNALPREDPPLRFVSHDLRERFRDVIRMDHICEPDFGLTRLDVLRRTRLHGDYADSDRVLLAELALHGRFHQIPEYLFFRRAHSQQSTAIAPDRQTRTVWFNPAYAGRLVFPHFRELREYLGVIRRAPVGAGGRASCYAALLAWVVTYRGRLIGDLEFAARELLRPLYRAVRRRTA
jgi:glycosyltransferase involved in cell wall biosynthesis